VALQIASFFSVPLGTIFALEEHMAQQAELLHQHQQQLARELHRELQQPNQSQEEPMSMVPWSPLREMREALDELMDETANWSAAPQVSAPAVNVSQTEREVVVEMRLPGYRVEDLSIEAGDDFLSLSGDTTSKDDDTDRHYFRREFVHQSFQRSIALPALVEGNKADAEMKHGVLTVRLPKIVEEKPKTAKIQIKSAE
jgi:HSP20 family protein